MMKINKIIEKDYKDLLSGNVKYLISSIEKIGYGDKEPWLKVFFWNIMHKHNKHSYDYPHYYSHYHIKVVVNGTGLGIRLKWDEEDMALFAKENDLHICDRVTVIFLCPKSNDAGYWSAGGTRYVITDDGWKVISELKGL